MTIALSLRGKGLKVDLDILVRGTFKYLQYADALSIPYVLIVGEDELKAEKLKLKNMESGEEKTVSLLSQRYCKENLDIASDSIIS